MMIASLGVLGLFVGSFLNVVVMRLEQGMSPMSGRSRCGACKKDLGWRDLIPLVSFLVLRGKCRFCKNKISLQYPLMEVATALLFMGIGFRASEIAGSVPFEVFLGYALIMLSILLVICVYDLRTFLIPDVLLFPAILFALGANLWWAMMKWVSWESVAIAVATGIAVAGCFLLVILLSRGTWMGMGDAKLALLLGLLVPWPNIVVGLAVAFGIGGMLGLLLIFSRKKIMRSEVPFAPFLGLGTMVAFLWGQELLYWYLGLAMIY